MRLFFILVAILVCHGPNFSSARSRHEKIRKSRPINSTLDAQDGSDDVRSNRTFNAAEPEVPSDTGSGNKTDEDLGLVNEFQSELANLREFAQSVAAPARNFRRSMHSEHDINAEITIFSKILEKTVIAILDAIESYVPNMQPMTKHIREIALDALKK